MVCESREETAREHLVEEYRQAWRERRLKERRARKRLSQKTGTSRMPRPIRPGNRG